LARNLANGKVFPVSEAVGRPPANTGSALMAKLSPTARSMATDATLVETHDPATTRHLLTEALRSPDPDFIWGLVSQLSQARTDHGASKAG
jgi:hypothetical protein